MESACRRTDPRAIPLDPPRGRQAVETTPAQATLAMGVIGGIVTWSSLRALRSRSVDTGLFLPALAAYAGHAFAHLAESAVAGGYTPGAITSPLVVLPYSVCAWQTLRHAGLADRQRVLRALGSGWPDAAGHPRWVRFGYLASSMPPEATPVNRRGAARLGPHALWGSPVWALKVFAPHTMAYLAGVPKTYAMTGDDAP